MIAIIHKGKIIVSDTPANIKNSIARTQKVTLNRHS